MGRGALPGGPLPPAPPSWLRPQVIWTSAVRSSALRGGRALRSRFLAAAHTEVLRVNRPRSALRQRRRRRCAHADRRVHKARVEDVRAVLGRGHPCVHNRSRARQHIGAPGDVLAHFKAARAVQVAAGAQALQGRLAIWADVFEVVLCRHRFAVALRRRFDLRVRAQRALASAFAFLIDQAQHRHTYARQIRARRHERRIRTAHRGCRMGREGAAEGEQREGKRKRLADTSHGSRIGSGVPT
jgi:hypothetical protein